MSAVIAIEPRARQAAPKTKGEVLTHCAACSQRESCLSEGMRAEDVASVHKIVFLRRRVRRGETLFYPGDAFHAIYAVRTGFFKTTLVDTEGREQVTGFSMGGELLGMEGLASGRHHGAAVALEDSEVCVLPYSLIEETARAVPALNRQMNALFAREITRDQGVMMLLGSMSAEARLATFLVNLSNRLLKRGYSQTDFHLRMTREEIGSYLGLKLETVSRLFSQFHKNGFIEVDQKHVRILDCSGLRGRAQVH